MAWANSAPSSRARLAPSPAKGDIRWAASPTRVAPGVRFQLWPTGSAWMGRRIGSTSLWVIRSIKGGAQPANASAIRLGSANQASGRFSAA